MNAAPRVGQAQSTARVCWVPISQAAASAGWIKEAKGQVTVLEPFLRKIRHHQLFLAGLQRAW